MKLILFYINNLSLQWTFLFYPNSFFLGTMYWPWSLLGHMHLILCQKHKLRVANAKTQLILDLTQPLLLFTLTHVKAMSGGWLL